MHGILTTFNEYQSRQSGVDIAYKMGQKARSGGTLGRAKLGYLNHIDHSKGRVIRTIIVGPERAPFVRLGFELFATNDYTQEDLADELYDRGLRTRATRRHPAKKISENKISQMLRDRYYLGYVDYDGEEIQGDTSRSSTTTSSTRFRRSSTLERPPKNAAACTTTTSKGRSSVGAADARASSGE
jgi:hypothetical protein